MKKQITAFLTAAVLTFGAVPAAETILPDAVQTGISASAADYTPAQVKGLTAKRAYTTITLTWDNVSNAKGYRVYVYDTAGKKYKKVITISGNTTSYQIKGLKAGTIYKYKVRAYRKADGKTYWGKPSAALSVTTKSYAPAKVAEASALATSIDEGRVTWSNVVGAKGFRLYIYDPASKKYKKVATMPSPYKDDTSEHASHCSVMYRINGLKENTVYKCKVRAYNKVNGVTYWGKCSSVVEFKTPSLNMQHNYTYGLTYDQSASADKVAKNIATSVMSNKKYKTDLEKVTAATKKVAEYCHKCRYDFDPNGYYSLPYGVFIERVFTCAGSTRALGRVLDYMGYKWAHTNENEYAHQWCVLKMDGKLGYADAMGEVAGYGNLCDNDEVGF